MDVTFPVLTLFACLSLSDSECSLGLFLVVAKVVGWCRKIEDNEELVVVAPLLLVEEEFFGFATDVVDVILICAFS